MRDRSKHRNAADGSGDNWFEGTKFSYAELAQRVRDRLTALPVLPEKQNEIGNAVIHILGAFRHGARLEKSHGQKRGTKNARKTLEELAEDLEAVLVAMSELPLEAEVQIYKEVLRASEAHFAAGLAKTVYTEDRVPSKDLLEVQTIAAAKGTRAAIRALDEAPETFAGRKRNIAARCVTDAAMFQYEKLTGKEARPGGRPEHSKQGRTSPTLALVEGLLIDLGIAANAFDLIKEERSRRRELEEEKKRRRKQDRNMEKKHP